MSRYEREFGTDWDTLDKHEATERAFAIGVAEKLGEHNREELEAVYEEMDTAYNASLVELAYAEGRREATEAKRDRDGGETVWAELVEDDAAALDPDALPTGGRDGLPEALDGGGMLDGVDIDSTDVVDRPGFLDR